MSQSKYRDKDYEYLVRYGYTAPAWGADMFLINGVIETGYKGTYGDLFEQLSKNSDMNINVLRDNPSFQAFFHDIYDRLGYSYTLNPNFTEEYLASESWSYPSYYKMVFNDVAELSDTSYILKNNPNGTEVLEYLESWRYTETPPSIPEGAKYIRVAYLPPYTEKFFDGNRDYPILAFDNGKQVEKTLFLYAQNSCLSTNGALQTWTHYVTSDYIEIPENATITDFVTVAPRNYPYCAFYDSDKNFISAEIAQNIPIDSEKTMLLPATAYEKLFPDVVEKLGNDWVDKITPQKMKLSHYALWDEDRKNPLFECEVTVTVYNESYIRVSEDLFSLFYKDSVFEHSLYFDGIDGIGAVLDTAEKLNFEPQSFTIEGIHTMTKAVDVFVPIFELIAIILCVGVIFILVNFSTKTIKDKMHEIGILKALGAKNTTIGVVFGLQVILIAVLTCILSTAGYYFFIDLANDVLIESLKRLAPSNIVLDLDFLTFKPKIALQNCTLIFILTLASLIIPLLKIKAIKPVKNIKAKE